MFKNLISFWKEKDFLKTVLVEFSKMMEDTKQMFIDVSNLLIRDIGNQELKDTIYKIDRQVNTLEKNIRTKIIEHLSIQPKSDLPFCLVLMSVVKDAERIGDYAKNIFEVWELIDKPFDNDTYQKLFDGLDHKLIVLFDNTKQAFIESDEKVSQEILLLEREIVKKCDSIVAELTKSNLSVNKAVCFSLLARYYKRVAAHLTNIGSSVILPISDLDFFDENIRHNNI